MELTVKDICELLELPEKSVLAMIQKGELPAYKIHNEYRFTKSEISEWVLKRNMPVSSRLLELGGGRALPTLTELLDKGGIFHGIAGNTVAAVLRSAVAVMPLPAGLDRDTLLFYMLEREELMPTAVGRGIAVPHPRNPLLTDAQGESISLCLLERPVDFGAMDGVPVHSLFIILSANPRHHLDILARIAYLCQQKEIPLLLRQGAEAAVIRRQITAVEQTWLARRSGPEVRR